MTPDERSFLTAVVRFQTLSNAGTPRADTELNHLARFLAADAPDEAPRPADRRRFRRFATKIVASARRNGVSTPCLVSDLGAGGLRVENLGSAQLRSGHSLVVTIESESATLRIDLPTLVKHVDHAGGWLGLEFSGAPLMLHQRNASRSGRYPRPAVGTSSGAVTRATSETPLAGGSPPVPDDLAA